MPRNRNRALVMVVASVVVAIATYICINTLKSSILFSDDFVFQWSHLTALISAFLASLWFSGRHRRKH